MNFVLTVVVIAGTYMLACLLLSALGRIGDTRVPADSATARPPGSVLGDDAADDRATAVADAGEDDPRDAPVGAVHRAAPVVLGAAERSR
jgi:hypothetical protein